MISAYPTGEEAVKINSAFDKFFGELKKDKYITHECQSEKEEILTKDYGLQINDSDLISMMNSSINNELEI